MELCHEQVRERAYYIWEGEGYADGCADAHWLQAEAELRVAATANPAEHTIASTPVKTAKPRASRAKTAAKAETLSAKPAAKSRSRHRAASAVAQLS